MTVTVHNADGLAAPLGLYSHAAEASGSRTIVVAGRSASTVMARS